jgi:hypothetical protein
MPEPQTHLPCLVEVTPMPRRATVTKSSNSLGVSSGSGRPWWRCSFSLSQPAALPGPFQARFHSLRQVTVPILSPFVYEAGGK